MAVALPSRPPFRGQTSRLPAWGIPAWEKRGCCGIRFRFPVLYRACRKTLVALQAAGVCLVGVAVWPTQAAEGEFAVSAQSPGKQVRLHYWSGNIQEQAGPTQISITAAYYETNPATQKAEMAPAPASIDITVSVTGTNLAGAVDWDPVGDFVITIPQGREHAAGTFVLKPENDALDEFDDVVTMSGKAPSIPVVSSFFFLMDDDPPPIVNVRALNQAAEPGRLDFSIFLDTPSAKPVRVHFNTHRQTRDLSMPGSYRLATTNADFTYRDGELVIQPGKTSETVSITVHDDAVDEPAEIVVLSLDIPQTAQDRARLARRDTNRDPLCDLFSFCTASICCVCGIINDDDASVEVVFEDAQAREDSDTLDFTVRLSAKTEKTIRFEVQTSDGTAEAGSDYLAMNIRTVPVYTDTLEATLSVGLLDDGVSEADETFELSVSNPARQVIIVDGTATGTIVDDGDPPQLSVAPAGAVEGDALEFVVTATTSSADTITVDYEATDGSAVSGQDYRATRGTLTLAPGRTKGAISVLALDDASDEPSETLSMTLSSPTNATLDVSSARGKILDNDVPPGLSVADASGEEGSTLEFLVSVSSPSGRTVEVNYKTSNGTALSGQDYQAVTGTLTFAPGEASGTVSVSALADALGESSETFALTLSSPVHATLSDASADGTIIDKDVRPELSVAGVSGGEGSALDFVVSLSATSTSTITVNYQTSDGTAVSGQDYGGAVGTLTFAPGETQGTVTVTTLDDALDESSETFALTLSSPTNATLDVSSADGTILDNNAPPQLSVAGAGGSEGDTLGFVVSASSASEETITVNYATTDGSALAGQDYGAARGTLTFAPGETSRTVSVPTLDDTLAEPVETFTLTLSSPENATLGVNSAKGRILDDTAGPRLSVAGATSEEGGAVEFVVTATPTGGQTVTVRYETRDGTAVVGQDYEAMRGTLRFAPGETTRTVSVATLDDALAEVAETFTLVLSSPAPEDFGTRTATGTIIDNDHAWVMLAASPASVPEGAGPTTVQVTAALEGARRDTATVVRVSVRGDSARETEDFAAVPGFRIEIPVEARSGTGTFTLSPVDDDQEEADETLVISGVSDLEVEPAVLSLLDGAPLETFRVLLFEAASNPLRQGFLRVINNSPTAGEVLIEATDDSGSRREPVSLSIEAEHAAHFNSIDLEAGNPAKGLSGGVGEPVRGDWRLKMSTTLDVDVLAYSRTKDSQSSTANAFVTAMNEVAPTVDGKHQVAFFNPGANQTQQSMLRLINTGLDDVDAVISGIDDAGQAAGPVRVSVPSLESVTLTAEELETGVAAGIVEGTLGRGAGKWRLSISAGPALVAKALLLSADKLTNLSSSRDVRTVPVFPPMSEPNWAGFLRVVNRSPEPGEVTLVATDAMGLEYEPLTLTLGALAAAHFNSADLELGNPGKGLAGSAGAGRGNWRLELDSPLDVYAVAYARSHDGFLTSIHDLVPQADGVHRANFFNPASNDRQVSWLHLLSDSDADALVTITGRDDRGHSSGSPVRLQVMAGTAVVLPSTALESGEHELIESGALGDGAGKWRLEVTSDRPLKVMSLLVSPTGHLTNVSTAIDPYDAPHPESGSGG